jgi:predicted helicase
LLALEIGDYQFHILEKYLNDNRFKIFLTNSLEEANPDQNVPLLAFMRELTIEGLEAAKVKNETPVMVILGNPPYSGESQNKSDWIMKLMEDYKKEPNSNEKLKEKNPKWINDDYVKFLRFGQYFIEKNGEGILAFINPHGFLDNPTFRSVRFSLLQTYDKIYAIDLHGNAKKKETTPSGEKDENVFDIQQGVSINIFVKNGKKKAGELAQVFHFDCFGKREDKYNFLWENSLSSIAFKTLPNVAPMYFMVQKDFELKKEYEAGFSVAELFLVNSVGIVTARDDFTIHHTKNSVKEAIEEFLKLDDEAARFKFKLGKDARDWKVTYARQDLIKNFNNEQGKFAKISYRPFDERWTYYTGKSKGFHCYPRNEVMQHFLAGENLGLALCKQFKTGDNYFHSFVTNQIIESSLVSNRTSEITSTFPLYIYNQQPESADLLNHSKPARVPNLNPEIIKEISTKLGLKFVPENESGEKNFSPINLLDYIYAVLHSPKYREKYQEFLKIDFPRVPYPQDQNSFWRLIKLGSELRKIHLLEGEIFEKLITKYPADGDNKVEKISYESNKVKINQSQYFEGVAPNIWEFFIGGYQPAQKWLKDRKGKILGFEEILHYQKIIVALSETDRLMKEIVKIN